MKDKLILYNSCVSIFQPNLQRSFGTASPVLSISGPSTPTLYSWAGSISYTSCPSIPFGTIDRLRPDFNDPRPLNRDQWGLWSTGTADWIRIVESKKNTITEHWTNGLPKDLENEDNPSWVSDFIDKMLDK